MRRSSKVALVLLIIVLIVGGWAGYYAQDKGFSRRWRNIVTNEFKKHGLHATIRRLNLDPLRGLIAKDVMIYEDEDHTILLMAISKVALDVQFQDIRSRKLFLRAFEIRNAEITLPLDPQKKLQGKSLHLENLSARVLLPPDQIEIVRAQTSIGGVVVEVSGSLFRPHRETESAGQAKTQPSLAQQQLARLQALRRQRALIARILEELEKCNFDPTSQPEVKIQVLGDMARLRSVQAAGTIKSGPFSYRAFEAASLDAKLEFDQEHIVVKDLQLKDNQGKLRAEFEHSLASGDLQFQLNSTIDLHPLLKSALPDPRLKELVFYQPPLIEASGVYHFGKPFSMTDLPFEVIGKFQADRTTSRGVIFEVMACDFSVNSGQLYIRNGRVEHKTGILSCDLLKDENGVRFRGDIRLHPTVFAPFLSREEPNKFLSRWSFNDQSVVLINLAADGPSMNTREWITTGEINLRNCELNQHPISELECEVLFDNKRRNFYNVVIRRPEGEIAGEHVWFSEEDRCWHFDEVRGRVFPTHAVAWFAPEAAQRLIVYDFDKPPLLTVSGVLDSRPIAQLPEAGGHSDYRITFASDSMAHYKLFGRDLDLRNPSGIVLIRGNTITLSDFRAGLLDGQLDASVVLTNNQGYQGYQVQASVARIDFHQFAQLFSTVRDTGGQMNGNIRLAAAQPGLEHLIGKGQVRITDGDVFSIPTFGPLSKPVADAFPKVHAGFSVAREANLDFTIRDNTFILEDFLATTKTFQLNGTGEIDLVSSEMDMNVTLNAKGAAGAILRPVSKLLEYKGEGSLSDPKWRPKNLPRLKDTPIKDITSTTAGALRRVGDKLPKRIPLGSGRGANTRE